jgi:hypothetical protein
MEIDIEIKKLQKLKAETEKIKFQSEEQEKRVVF